MGRLDQRYFRNSREWICSRAQGEILEVAIGTGLNLPYYPPGVRLTGMDYSAPMLDVARQRAAELGLAVDLRVGNAEALDWPAGSFDTVVCTFSLCAIPDHRAAIAEMVRVLRPGGLLLLADHVRAANPLLRAGQWLVELVSIPASGEHYLRQPSMDVEAAGLTIEVRERFGLGMVERLVARR
jgi:ubiquinone/menaquinone biosynthesis C-methylase UbiE